MAATQVKLTLKRGQRVKDVADSAGTTIVGGDAVELNIDAEFMTDLDICLLLDQLKMSIINGKWRRT